MIRLWHIVLLLVCQLWMINDVCGQDILYPSRAAKEYYQIHRQMYNLGKQWQDDEMVYTALIGMASVHPEDSDVKKELVECYLKFRQYQSCKILGEELLNEHPDDKDLLEDVARCKEMVGELSEAILMNDRLHNLTGNPYYAYHSAYLQYSLKRYYECKENLEKLQANPKIDTQFVDISYGDPPKTHTIPLKAAIYNLYGLVLQELNDLSGAERAFLQSIEISPDFELPRQNLSLLKSAGYGN